MQSIAIKPAKKMKKFLIFLSLWICCAHLSRAGDGYRLWLRYDKVSNKVLLSQYRSTIKQVVFPGNSPTLMAAQEELSRGLSGLFGTGVTKSETIAAGSLVVGAISSSKLIAAMAQLRPALKEAGNEGYVIRSLSINGKPVTVIAANTDRGVLYGVFNFLKLLQTNKSLKALSIVDYPRIQYRLLDHWDNLPSARDPGRPGTVERGYAGRTIWDWANLPGTVSPRYKDYARANASIGINGAVLNNVNANVQALSKDYLAKAAAIADVLRPYGIRVFLSAKFSAPIELGGLKISDPLDAGVIKWWTDKVNEIYTYIPDFGGFVVKANSEGQPGPMDYGRSHAEGANMFAEALAPHKGIVMWRAFVYDNKVAEDRAMQAYQEFHPLDGKFKPNVVIQIKNGPLDFQPREPFSPLFGAMPKTPEMMEFQVTKEYLGDAGNLVYLAPLWKECLDSDTYAHGKGSTVAKVLEGKVDKYSVTGIAGVANIGTDTDWCGNNFAQSNWYAYGRLAWRPEQTSAQIADDWIRMTFNNDASFIEPVKQIMLTSREAAVNYMTPLGLNMLMATGTHYGPAPWNKARDRADQTAPYHHRADSIGLGFDRTAKTGFNAVGQYNLPLRGEFENVKTTPDEYLMWFHHVPWNYKMKSGKTMWIELIEHYNKGVDAVKNMRAVWAAQKSKVDAQRFADEVHALNVQLDDAETWRDACLLYFQTFSKLPIPDALGKPAHDLDYYKKLHLVDKRKLDSGK